MPFPNKSTQFKKGQSGNPNGQPRKLPQLDKLLDRILGEEGADGLTMMDRILDKVATKAAAGDLKAAEILLDRGYGKAKQSLEIDDVTKTPRPIVVQTPEAAELVRKLQEGTIGTD
jgi:hypothetical protein